MNSRLLSLSAAACLLLVVYFATPGTAPAQEEAPTGFHPDRVAGQLACEARLKAIPKPEQFREHLRTITKEPHPAGSEAQRRVEQYLVDVMENAGLEVTRYPYDVYLPQLTDDVTAEIITPEHITLTTQEGELEEDRFSGHPDLLNGWNAYSGSGDVTGHVVYANQGRKEDFEQLREWGIEVEGKVVIARYGGNFRGYKVKFAQEYGAIGVIMFNDPGNNYGVMEYPDGPNMNSTTIQRGSVLTLDWTGDPLTPFEPAYTRDSGKPVNRLDPADVALHKIPVLPMGYGAAREILDRMTGEAAPDNWHSGIPTPHRIEGGDELTVRVRVNQPKALTLAVNVIGTIRGTEFPDEWVLFGAHYDPWGFGAIDPNGGTSMLLTMAEALGELAADGCAPRRSIMIGHWDAEEYGIIGSAEWVEELRDELTANAIAYINADSAVSGPRFGSSGSPSLKEPILEATKTVEYPNSGMSVYDHWLQRTETDVAPIGHMGGGGSDHVGFYSHIGVPSGSLGFGGSGGVYHSNYDNFAWYERFGDHEFIYGPTLARVNGVLALRLANADVLPYGIARYAADLTTHTNRIAELAEAAGMSPDLSGLRGAIDSLEETAAAYEAARDSAVLEGDFPDEELRAVNAMLIALERTFVHEEGLQGRPWFRSLFASPDPFSGYASWLLPGLRYEIETDNAEQLAFWETVYVDAVDRLTERVDALRARLDTN